WSQSLQPNATEAWFRREFELSSVPEQPLVFWINAWGDFEVFLNGVRAVDKFGSARKQFQLAVSNTNTIKVLRSGRNVIALHATKLRPPGSVNVAVYQFPQVRK